MTMSHQEETQDQQTGVLRRGLESLESFSQAMEERVEMYALVLAAICLCVLFKILNVNNSPEKSLFYCANQKFLEEFLKRAPELAEPYIPTRFWGFSGHLQTIIQVRQTPQIFRHPGGGGGRESQEMIYNDNWLKPKMTD